MHSFINLMNHKASQVLKKKKNHSSLCHAFWSRSHSGQGRGGWEKGAGSTRPVTEQCPQQQPHVHHLEPQGPINPRVPKWAKQRLKPSRVGEWAGGGEAGRPQGSRNLSDTKSKSRKAACWRAVRGLRGSGGVRAGGSPVNSPSK